MHTSQTTSNSRAGKQWFDCIQCHVEQEDKHKLLERPEMVSHVRTHGSDTTDVCSRLSCVESASEHFEKTLETSMRREESTSPSIDELRLG